MYIFIWILFGLAAMMIATSKGSKGGTWFLLGILFGPFALIASLMITGIECPYCKKKIHKDALICPYCKKEFNTDKENDQTIEFINKIQGGK